MRKESVKRAKTVRFNEDALERIRRAAVLHHLSEAEVIRDVVNIGLVDLLNGEDQDELLRQRLADRTPDIDGYSFLNSLKAEFDI